MSLNGVNVSGVTFGVGIKSANRIERDNSEGSDTWIINDSIAVSQQDMQRIREQEEGGDGKVSIGDVERYLAEHKRSSIVSDDSDPGASIPKESSFPD